MRVPLALSPFWTVTSLVLCHVTNTQPGKPTFPRLFWNHNYPCPHTQFFSIVQRKDSAECNSRMLFTLFRSITDELVHSWERSWKSVGCSKSSWSQQSCKNVRVASVLLRHFGANFLVIYNFQTRFSVLNNDIYADSSILSHIVVYEIYMEPKCWKNREAAPILKDTLVTALYFVCPWRNTAKNLYIVLLFLRRVHARVSMNLMQCRQNSE